MSDIIPIPSVPTTPALQLFAIGELEQVNSSLARRIDEHRTRYAAFWKTYQWTPDEILQQFGTSAVIWLQAAAESVNHINRLAQIVGKTVGDLLPAADYIPPRAFIPNPDGTVTLAPPAEGYDAWGRVILPPVPTPEPMPEYIPETPTVVDYPPEPEPVIEPEVVIEPEPVIEIEPVIEPEVVVEPEVVETEPIVEPEVIVEEPVDPEIITEPEPAILQSKKRTKK